MASCHVVLFHCLQIYTVLLMLGGKSSGKKTQTYYMDGADCGDAKYLGGATIYSHNTDVRAKYSANVECRITMKAENEDWKLMARVEYLHIPDITHNSICNDALYLYDAGNIFGAPILEAGGNNGLCGSRLPPVIYSSGQYLTVFFRSDRGGKSGRGFKIVVTAFSEEYHQFKNCGSNFLCGNEKCIDEDLVCDQVDHCGDNSDESSSNGGSCAGPEPAPVEPTQATAGPAATEPPEEDLWDKLLSLGIAASVAIVAGSVIVVIVCVVCTICLCRRCAKKKPEDANDPTSPVHANNPAANQYSRSNNIGMPPPIQQQHLQQQQLLQQQPLQYTQGTNYYPMTQSHPAYTQQAPVGYTAMAVRDRESYSQSSAYSSLPPQSVQSGFSQPMHTRPTNRSVTPTSSRSGNSKSDVAYQSNPEKLAFPVHL